MENADEAIPHKYRYWRRSVKMALMVKQAKMNAVEKRAVGKILVSTNRLNSMSGPREKPTLEDAANY